MTVEEFSKHPQFYDVKICPDGKYIAVLINTEGRKTLAFLETDTKNKSLTLYFAASVTKLETIYWVITKG
ncbi:hypothetical protein TUM4261_02090 [Shewanella sp. c952]|nr:hypothetical protein TUM4261_02090 [Shewanella sp. c952]